MSQSRFHQEEEEMQEEQNGEKSKYVTVSSSSRVKSFFQFDPCDLIDDTISAVTQYINDALVSFSEHLKASKFSQSEIDEIRAKITREISNSLAVNADLFEMYLLRNIFNIPLSIDLASVVTNNFTENSATSDSIASIADIPSIKTTNKDLNDQIEDLRQQIIHKHKQYTELCHSIQEKEVQALYLENLVKRFDRIEKVLKQISSLPTEEARKLCESSEDCLRKAQEIQERVQSATQNNLNFQKNSFTFD
ncbi:hypothetical protein TVAG_222860 [Trichomonas vaginalis G3]|uniref:Uncharacterized protein n=1 Tax=Trichomonas vaginalis (strain ATCC PRA-98 / G3) TaxID=412133 RepID=A2FHY0_TRIV3|nr:MIS12-like protein family [Trichomonas vaginalis G3]EAX95489.1 hypothetical protein TVAG_222860 [Trichomonas vaginalis G3]KAI5531078.1 MIS12-like protein family [Trichomonas vaginalis G3]|eukprot:XP_001308419.1 hypothetical protein [Trichomonas vaginalis G3]